MANTKVTGDLIAGGTITTFNLADGSVTAAKLNSITTDNISEGTNLFYTDARVATYLSANNYITSAAVANSANWDTAYSWGDHSTVGYLTSFTETDPIYTASSWFNTTNNASNWDTAYSWGNHATQSYATETYVNTAVANLVDSAPTTLDTLNELAAALGDDPNFATTVSTSIGTKWTQDNTKISNWDTAYSWGNHASAGYLTSFTETDPTVPAHVKSITTTNISNWNTAYGWGNHASAGYLTSLPSHTHDDRYYTESESDSRFWRVTPSSINVTTTNPFDNSLTGTRVTGNGNYLIQYTGASAQLISSATGGSASIFQIGAHYNGSDFYMRTRIDSSNWQDWKKLWHNGNLTSTSISNWDTAYSWGNHASAGYLTSFDITTQTDPKYLRSDTSDTMSGTLTASGLNISGKAEFQGDAAIEGGTGFGIFKGYTLNNNHFVASRCIVTGSTSSPTFTAGHDMTFVEYLNTTDRGFRFKNSSTGSYVEVAGIFTDRSEFAGSVRSPIFYDSNNTGYYVDPASTSNLNSLNVNGNLGVGTTSPPAKLTLRGTGVSDGSATFGAILDRGTKIAWTAGTHGSTGEYIYSQSGSPYAVTIHSGGYNALACPNTGHVYINHESGTCSIGSTSFSTSYKLYVTGAIYATQDITAYSDARKKENVKTIDKALEKVNKLRGVYYNRLDLEDKSRQIGVIAQEVEKIIPEAVKYTEDNDEYGVKYGNMVGVLIEAIKELSNKVEELENKLNGTN